MTGTSVQRLIFRHIWVYAHICPLSTKSTNPICGGLPALPPDAGKFGLLLSRNVHTIVRRLIQSNSFSVRTRPDLSISVLTSHKTAKNLCERDALPTELYPQRTSKLSRRWHFHQSIFCNVELRRRPSLGIWIRFVSQLKADSSGTSGSRWLEANQSRLKRVD